MQEFIYSVSVKSCDKRTGRVYGKSEESYTLIYGRVTANQEVDQVQIATRSGDHINIDKEALPPLIAALIAARNILFPER